jgi:hypothetical protein
MIGVEGLRDSAPERKSCPSGLELLVASKECGEMEMARADYHRRSRQLFGLIKRSGW